MLSELTFTFSLFSTLCGVGLSPSDKIYSTPILEARSPDLRDLYDGAMSFDVFLEEASRRKDQWIAHYEQAVVPGDVLARINEVEGQWFILAVAEDWCSDSVNTIPYIARLADASDKISLRIIRSEEGREIMDAHPTPDGRGATPTVLVLDSQFEMAGCFIERPTELQNWAIPALDSLEQDAFREQKQAWYDEDSGASTLEAIAAIIEAATQGESICGDIAPPQ